MIKIGTSLKSTPFNLEFDGVEHELTFNQFTIADSIRMAELNKTLLQTELKDSERGLLYMFIRVMCSVRDSDGEYFWPDGTDPSVAKSLPEDCVVELLKHVNEINPVALPKIDDGDDTTSQLDKKKQS